MKADSLEKDALDRGRARRSSRSFPAVGTRWMLLPLLVLVMGCSEYYGGYRYLPDFAIHELKIARESPAPASEIQSKVHIVGVLRPTDAEPRRMHSRLEMTNRAGTQNAELLVSRCRLLPSGAAPLTSSDGQADLTIEPGATRTIELFFALPSRETLPSAALSQLEFEWTTRVGDVEHVSRAAFDRFDYDVYPYGPSYYYYHDPFYCGPWFYVHHHGHFCHH